MAKELKLPPDLWDRIEKAAEAAGYSSPEELVTSAVERELARLEQPDPSEAVKQRLKGLGYIE